MAYEQLKTDVIDVLKCKDNNLELKMYNKDGNNTLSTEEVEWIYVPNKKMVLTMPNEENQKLIIGKNDIDFDEEMNRVLRGIRKICNLNGVELSIHKYSDISKRGVYNIVKQYMYESVGKDLAKMIISLKGFKTESKNYLPIEAKLAQINTLVENALDTIKLMPCGKNEKLMEALTSLTHRDTKNIVDCFNKIDMDTKKALSENLSNINNAFEFTKNQCNVYGKPVSKYPIVKMNEWVKVMKIDEAPMRTNMQKAGDMLRHLSENAKTRYDLMKIIRDNHICENYMVSKEALLDEWISGKSVETSWSYLIETVKGEERIIDKKYPMAVDKIIRVIGENKGSYDSSVLDLFIKENARLNNLVDFTRKYRDNKVVEKYVPIAARLCKECLNYFNSNEIEPKQHLSASNEETVGLLETAVGGSHPCFDEVVANYEILEEEKQTNILNETKREKEILVREFNRYFDGKRAKKLAESVMNGDISLLPDVSVEEFKELVVLPVKSVDPNSPKDASIMSGEIEQSPDIAIGGNVSMAVAPSTEDKAKSALEIIQTFKNNFYMIDPVMKTCMDNYLACKCYQTELQLLKFKPVWDLIQKYVSCPVG